MDSAEETLYDKVDCGNDSSGDDDEDDDDDDDDDTFLVENETDKPREIETKVEECPFEILSMEEIVQVMAKSVKEISTVMQIQETTARILLHHYKWDKQMLMERFCDGNQNQLFAEGRVINPFRKPTVVKLREVKPQRTSADNGEECEICFMVLPSFRMTGLDCGHKFCKQQKLWRRVKGNL
jgi:ariadne-1